jgi:UV DNA damage endonuclease
MHPDQFIVLNSPDPKIVNRSMAELEYHVQILNLMNLDNTTKIQLHTGGVYKDKQKSMKRFVKNYEKLSKKITDRLVIENDGRSYGVKDCFKLNELIGLPILFDYYHHEILNNKEELNDVLRDVETTWNKKDGIPMVDYSSQKLNERTGAHAEHIEMYDFSLFLLKTYPFDFDLMLEIKDKESSALKALELLKKDKRFIK